jgi:hypothetical protein
MRRQTNRKISHLCGKGNVHSGFMKGNNSLFFRPFFYLTYGSSQCIWRKFCKKRGGGLPAIVFSVPINSAPNKSSRKLYRNNYCLLSTYLQILRSSILAGPKTEHSNCQSARQSTKQNSYEGCISERHSNTKRPCPISV